MRGLRLTQHRRRVERRAPRSREQIRNTEEDRSALLPRRPRPVVPRRRGGVRGLLHVLRIALRDAREDAVGVVRGHLVERLAERDVLPADHERQLERLPRELRELRPELLALRAARSVISDRLVVRCRRLEDGVSAHRGRLYGDGGWRRTGSATRSNRGAWASCGSSRAESYGTSRRDRESRPPTLGGVSPAALRGRRYPPKRNGSVTILRQFSSSGCGRSSPAANAISRTSRSTSTDRRPSTGRAPRRCD